MRKITLIALLSVFFLANIAIADVAPEYRVGADKKNPKNQSNQIQKTYTGVFDVQKNTISNIDFYTSNYGIFGLDVARSLGGGVWPRGSQNQYIFGGGIWFAAKKPYKPHPDSAETMRKYVIVSYNPNSGKSWLVPGRIEDGDYLNKDDIYKYRTVFSIDFKGDGTPIQANDKYNWPIWDDSPEDTLKLNRYFGHFIYQDGMRNTTSYPKGPAFISGEDIFATFKDTDLNYYEGGVSKMTQYGYPLRIQFEKTIYSWGFGDYKDFIFLRYDMINKSGQDLEECWLAPVMDVDIALTTNSRGGASNDRVKYYDKEDTLNLAVQWSNSDAGERNRGFGYLGFDFLESPAVDQSGYIRKDKRFYNNKEQIGLVTFRNWSIEEDKQESEERYNYIASSIRDGDTGPGDKRFLMATGPFSMRSGDTARVVVGIILANTSKGGDADGSWEDMEELIRKDKFAQQVYDNNFQAPTPPDRSVFIKTKSFNGGVAIEWDESAEMSVDTWEKGLDFLGLKLYRARRSDLDTFDINQIAGGGNYPRGKGPFGWKQLAAWELPKPFEKSYLRAGGSTDGNMPQIDSLAIVGPYTDATGKVIDTMSIRVMRLIRGGLFANRASVFAQTKSAAPFISYVDTALYSFPWGKEYAKILAEDGIDLSKGAITYNPAQRIKLFDSVMVGVVKLNKALVPYNPLFYRKSTIQVDTAYINSLLKQTPFKDGYIGKTFTLYDTTTKKTDTIRTTIDTVLVLNSLRGVNMGGGKLTYFMDILTHRSVIQQMNDTNHVNEVLSFVYESLLEGKAKAEFPDWEQSYRARKNCIIPYFTEVTNGRTFIDIGDDNRDAKLTKNLDPTKTEGLINNIPYLYSLIAYDEGDYNQPTPRKSNDASDGLPNFTRVIPTAATVSEDPDVKIIITPEDSLKIGGLYNFKFFTLDKDRFLQNFAGHDLELTFFPYWRQNTINFPGRGETGAFKFGLYQTRAVMKDLTTNNILFDGLISYEDQPCNPLYRGSFTEDAGSFVLADSVIVDSISGKEITFGTMHNKEMRTRTGRFSTGSFRDADPAYCYTLAMQPPAYGTFGFGFDFTIHQFGGRYRPDSLTITTAKAPDEDAVTPVNFIDDVNRIKGYDDIIVTQPVGVDYSISPVFTVDGSFNNGPGVYEVEFMPGGKDVLNLWWGDNNKQTAEFEVDYLTIKVRNLTTFNRANELGPDSVQKSYPVDVPAMDVPTYVQESPTPSLRATFPTRAYPDIRNLGYGGIDRLNPRTNEFIGKHLLVPYAWINSRGDGYNTSPLRAKRAMARANYEPFASTTVSSIDRINKYYLSGRSRDGNHTIDFSHILNIGGVQFALDYANMGRTNSTAEKWKPLEGYVPGQGQDFNVGDKIVVRSTGGALGLPMPGAKVLFKVNSPAGTDGNYTDELMDRIQVVPNPYFITHQGQRSPYDAKVYFTKIPSVCKIEIFTINGELVRTIDHEDATGNMQQQASLEVWDLLNLNGQRVQSQAFVAVITAPNGAQTVRNFSVVVGGFRIIQE